MINQITANDFSKEEIDEMVKKEKKKTPNRFTHNHYKIFRVEVDEKTGKEKKITMKKFWAKTDADALKELNDYKKVANKQYTYYYSTTGYYIDKDPKTGQVRHFDDMEELMENWKDEHDNIFRKISHVFSRVLDKLSDVKYFIRDVIYFIRTRHDYRESWQLDSHFIDDLEHNLPLIKKDKNGVPAEFCMRAAEKMHAKDKNFDISEYMKKNPSLDEDGLMELATKMFDEEVDKCILYVKLYKYYSYFGHINKKNKEEVEFDKVWRKTLPFVPGTYNELDYKKLDALTKRNWNAIMNWCKDNLQFCGT